MPRTRRIGSFSQASEDRWTVLHRTALVLAIAVVIARATLLETLRDPFPVLPGMAAIPRSAGPTSSLLLDLLACGPALMVLTRRAMDRTFTLRWHWSYLPLFLLGSTALASTLYAGDKFAAMVRGADFLAACALLWGVSQVLRDWKELRLVAAAMIGLLLVFIAHGLMYRTLDVPSMRQDWVQNKPDILKRANLEEGTFAAHQFELKWLGGEMMGFSASPNTFATLLGMLGLVTLGVMAQRLADRDGAGWAAGMAVVIALTIYIGHFTMCRTVLLTALLGAAALAATVKFRPRLAPNWKVLYWTGVAAILLAFAAVIATGLLRGDLIERSLTFRWHYWVGSLRLWLAHPLLGVGFSNFGEHYLMFRLPVAPEEIKDPHNVLVHFFTELGLVGGLLALAWMLRMWWELTRPVTPPTLPAQDLPGDEAESQDEAVGLPAAITAIAMVLNIAASMDWSGPPQYELFKRGIFALLLFVGMMAGGVRPQVHPVLDDRPAPCVLYAILIGLGMFLLHNLIDFSMFETGPLFCFALLAGAALGARTPTPEPSRRSAWGWPMLLAATAAWLLAAGTLLIPTAMAEDAAQQGDENVRNNRLLAGAARLEQAAAHQRLNGDYAFRAAKAYELAGTFPERIEQLYAQAIATAPYTLKYWRERAMFEFSSPQPNRQRIVACFEQALALDPHNTSLRLLYADALREMRMYADAAHHYELALKYDNQLPPTEIRRLSPKKVEAIQSKIAEMRTRQ